MPARQQVASRCNSRLKCAATAADTVRTGTPWRHFMPHDACVIDSDSLREHLTARDPMQRFMALHALEIEVERRDGCGRGLTHEVARFTSRGVPYYALHDPHFQEWV